MRKISEQAYNAFISRKKYKNNNTRVEVENGESKLYLHNNLIAYTEKGETFVSDGNYGPSNTTRDRLNSFPEIWLRHKKGEWICGKGIYWDGKWTNIKLLEQCMYNER